MKYKLIAPMNPRFSTIEQVLKNRGIQDIQHYLNTTDADILDPKLLANIQEAAKMLVKHISNQSDIFIIVDGDADGYTSASTLINYLYELFPAYVRAHLKYAMHPGKEHGIDLAMIPKGTKLLICPDSASNDYDEHLILKSQGIDILVLDHHEADKRSPHACIVNNQMCEYPTKSLSGVGIVYKFCQYIDQLLGTQSAEHYLDMVALGIISDVMPMRDFETKRIIEKGLAQITNPFFRKMSEKQAFKLGTNPTPFGVAFYITPFINATVRVGTMAEKTLLFESMLTFKAYDLIPSTKRGEAGRMETRVEQACRMCGNVKNHQAAMRDEGYEIIEEVIQERGLLDNKILVVKLKKSWDIPKPIVGLIANQLMDKYQRPVLLLNEVNNPDGTTSWAGSGRGYTESGFEDFKAYLTETGLMDYCTGHANAFGTSLSDKNLIELINLSNSDLANYDFTPCHKVDFIWEQDEVHPDYLLSLTRYANIWGKGVEEPNLAIEHIRVTKDNLTLMSPDKHPTLKIQLPSGIEVIKFGSSQEEYEALISNNGCTYITVVGTAAANEWRGNVTAQLLIKDYEITNKMKYYF